MGRRIDKTPSPPRQDLTGSEPLSPSTSSLEEGPPPDSPAPAEEERAAGLIQRAFKKYRTTNASKGVAEQALKTGDTQGEVWARRRAGQHTRAKEVQEQITEKLTHAPVKKATAVEAGRTHGTLLVTTGKERGILKPGKGGPADSNAEVAAYKMDLLIGLNAVPVTVQRSERYFGVGVRGKLNKLFRRVFPEKVEPHHSFFMDPRPVPEGEVPDSNQRYVGNTRTMARGSTYYVPHLQDIQFFDRLIGNPDRHGANLLVADEPLETTGKPRYIAIDHGLAFISFGHTYVSLEREIPSEEIFERTKYMSKKRFERMLGPHLNREVLAKVWLQRKELVRSIDEWIEKNGRPSHWSG